MRDLENKTFKLFPAIGALGGVLLGFQAGGVGGSMLFAVYGLLAGFIAHIIFYVIIDFIKGVFDKREEIITYTIVILFFVVAVMMWGVGK